MYTPQNLAIFTAAFAGAIAGMGSSGRVISDDVSADYSGLATVAGAFAQSVDTEWGATSPTTQMEAQAMEEACETSWQDRSPNAVAPFTNPSNYTTLSKAIIALVKAGDSYLISQGIASPVVPGSAAMQQVWYVDTAIGNDTNDGATPATPKKMVSTVVSGLNIMNTGFNYLIQVLNNNVPSTDSFKPSYISTGRPDNINATSGIAELVNITLQGTLFPIAGTGAGITGFTATGVNQALITLDNAAVVTANVDQMFRIVTSADAGNVGATFGIGRDMGAGVARISDITAAPGKTLNTGAFVGSTVEAVTSTSWDADLQQLGCSQGRFTLNYLTFSAVAVAPANQNNITFRNVNCTFQACRFERQLNSSFGSVYSIVGCLFIGNATYVSNAINGGVNAISSTLVKNLIFNPFGAGIANFGINGLYLENSKLETRRGNNPGVIYGGTATTTAAGATLGVSGSGLSVYNYPAGGNNAGIAITDISKALFLGRVRGGFDVAPFAGAIGLLVENGSEVGILSTITPTIAGDNGGTGADVRIENPLGADPNLACRALQGGAMPISVAGAVTIDAQTLNTWANWAGAGANQFQRYAFNPHTGAKIYSVLNA